MKKAYHQDTLEALVADKVLRQTALERFCAAVGIRTLTVEL